LPFLKNHCGDCHAGDADEGDFQFDRQLSGLMTDRGIAAKWVEVVNVLNSHEMPPEDSPQPEPQDVAKLVDWVTTQLTLAERVTRSSKVVLRRLNRAEYRNTIRDLMGVDFDTSMFPEDAAAGGFDNNGSALSFSPLHTELYLQAATKILDQVFLSEPKPQAIRWRFEPETGDSDSNRIRFGENNAIVNGGQNEAVASGRLIRTNQWDTTINARDFRVPHPGPYVIRIHAGSNVPKRDEVVSAATKILDRRLREQIAENPGHEERLKRDRDADIKHFQDSPIYEYGPARVRVTVHLDGQPTIIGEADVTGRADDGLLSMLEFPVTMTTDKAGITLEYAYNVPSILENFWMQKDKEFARPELLVDWFELEGPVYPVWPPEISSRWLPDALPSNAPEQEKLADAVLTKMMPLSYRREVTGEELNAKKQVYFNALKASGSFATALKAAMTSVLMSPNFLCIVEPDADPSSPLTPDEVATRMSYFLWSSMPDRTIRELAKSGRLAETSVRVKLVDIMLDDSRSAALVDNFASQWLGLREVGSNPPAADLFPRYDDHLEASMVAESKAFFDHVLRSDLSIDCFIDSDFALVNERLARFYGIRMPNGSNVRGDEIRVVPLTEGSHRGGVVTQGSVLTLTSNGTRTTPVKRGTWILKTLLDADPGLPVANAGEISPKVPGIDKATVRQRLEIHRELPQCARCHDKIDPLGFALENYDASGQWRDQEGFGYKGRISENDPVIDATGQLPDGTKIDGIDGLQAALMKKRTHFHRALTTKMFTYAMGREMTLVDGPQIDRAVNLLATQRDDLRTLIKAIVTSEIFAQR